MLFRSPDAVVARHDSTRSDSFWLLLRFEVDEIPILGELANQGIDPSETIEMAERVYTLLGEYLNYHSGLRESPASKMTASPSLTAPS